MKINHEAGCMCGVFNLTCDKADEMHESVKEIMERADKVAEVVELLDAMAKSEEERCMYMFLFGKEWQVRKSNIEDGIETRSFRGRSMNDILGKIFKDLKRRAEEGRDEEE